MRALASLGGVGRGEADDGDPLTAVDPHTAAQPRHHTERTAVDRPGNVDQFARAVPERAAGSHLLIMDHVGCADLAVTVQCLATDREVLYFPGPSVPEAARIRRSYPISAGSVD